MRSGRQWITVLYRPGAVSQIDVDTRRAAKNIRPSNFSTVVSKLPFQYREHLASKNDV